MAEFTPRERGRLVTLIMRAKFLARRVATITARGGMATWDEAEQEALIWAVGQLRGIAPTDVAEAERKAEERWTQRSTDKDGQPREPLISAVCRLLGGCQPAEVIERLEVALEGAPIGLYEALGDYAPRRACEALDRVRDLVAKAHERDESLAMLGVDSLRDLTEARGQPAEVIERLEAVIAERDELRVKVVAFQAQLHGLRIEAYRRRLAEEVDTPLEVDHG